MPRVMQIYVDDSGASTFKESQILEPRCVDFDNLGPTGLKVISSGLRVEGVFLPYLDRVEYQFSRPTDDAVYFEVRGRQQDDYLDIEGLTPGQDYRLRQRFVTRNEINGEWGPPLDFTTPLPPEPEPEPEA